MHYPSQKRLAVGMTEPQPPSVQQVRMPGPRVPEQSIFWICTKGASLPISETMMRKPISSGCWLGAVNIPGWPFKDSLPHGKRPWNISDAPAERSSSTASSRFCSNYQYHVQDGSESIEAFPPSFLFLARFLSLLFPSEPTTIGESSATNV